MKLTHKLKWYLYGLTQVLSATICAIGTIAVIGHFQGRPNLYIWANDVGMAVSTAVAFVLTGAVLFAITVRVTRLERFIENL